AIAYLLQVELPRQLHDEFGKSYNALSRKISKLGNAEWRINTFREIKESDIDLLEDTENQLMKGSIEERAEINLTYDINTEYGKQKIRELFYNSKHDEAQAELFEKVFAMAQKLNVEVRHALRNPHKTFSQRNATTMVLGWYQMKENSARVKHGGNIKVEEKGEVLLHELVHSVTSRAIFLKEQGHTELLNPAQVKAIEEIEKIYQAVLDKAEELGFEKFQKITKDGVETYQGDYGLQNAHEFIAELANPVFREKLKQVAMFDDTVKAITEVATGVEKTETAYDRLTAALYQIMDNYEPDFGARYEQAKYGNIKMNDIFIEPEQQENTMKIRNLYKDKDGFAVNMRQFNDGDYDYSVFFRDTFLKSFRSPEYAIQAIHQNKTALFEEYHSMTYRPSHTENGVTYFTGGFTYLNEKRENTMKTPLEVIAKVMNKYATPIDNKDGLMNKPLNQLSPQELEDRLTVAAARESRAIQYGYEPDDMQRLHNDLSKSFAEIIELSKQTDQESRSKLATSQEEMLNVLKVMQDAGMSLRYMPVAGLNNPVIENLITKAEIEQSKQQEQTMKTENSLPENSVKQDAFGLPESIEKEQTMKTSQDILAEVMSKYEVHIDSKDGLMNKPLHWLSATELEDRRTVLSCRIDKAIQNSDSKTEERLDLEYINVENEMARRKTLSGNLKEVLEKQPETLSVRDFIVLAENREELKRQLKNAIEKGGMSVKLTAIEDKIKAFNQPEKFSIDDRQAFFEYSFRKADMALSENRFLYGENDKSVQEKLAERTEILQKLATLSDSQKEQTAEKGVVSSPKEDMSGDLFLSSTQALLYWELENAIHWRYQYIAEQKEIPIPQSFIDTETARIEYCSKELNERLYGDEYQKYRDMFPEKIKEIQDDFNRMVKNLKTSPETAVKHDLNTLPEQEQTMKTENSLPENSVKQDAFGLPENYQVRAADFDDFNPNLDGKTIT
ncbi:MAG: hypothetical protein J6W29_01685, partial [Neisseriaceae bacterium]|nr:hypothetical protein [Neisseriaceae bacterium]